MPVPNGVADAGRAAVDRGRAARQDVPVQMTVAYASAVTVSIPIFVLAAGAEARAVRERLKRADPQWEREFAAYRAERELDLGGRPSEVFGYLRDVPWVSRLYLAERLLAIGAALVWLAVFVLLAVAELRSLVWLADGSRPGNTGLASFALLSIAIAMAALILAPAAYLLLPLALPFDLVPKGLKDEVKSKVGQEKGKSRSFLRLTLSELEGAVDRAAARLDEGAGRPDPHTGEPGPEPEQTAEPGER
jgi:hypothetical protein